MMDTASRFSGKAYLFYAFDVGFEIDLARARAASAAAAPPARERRRGTPISFQYEPPPVRVALGTVPAPAGLQGTAEVEGALFDFGGACLRYTCSITGALGDLPALSHAVADADVLLADARERIAGLLDSVRPAVAASALHPFIEYYVALHVETPPPEWVSTALDGELAAVLARGLRAETGALSPAEIRHVLDGVLTYGPTDWVAVGGTSALIFDTDCADVVDLLEFTNLQLLELRCIDQSLDAALDQAYELVVRPQSLLRRVVTVFEDQMRLLARLKIDNAVVFERVENAIKLVGDSYLARVHTITGARFHLQEWERTIERKLAWVGEVYDAFKDRSASLRMELLEWIIIILIALSIVQAFFAY